MTVKCSVVTEYQTGCVKQDSCPKNPRRDPPQILITSSPRQDSHTCIWLNLVTFMSLIIVTPILLLLIIISYFHILCILTGQAAITGSSAVNLLHISLLCRRLCHDPWEWRPTPSVTYQHNVCFVWATPSEAFSMHSSHQCGRKGESLAAGDKLIPAPFPSHPLFTPSHYHHHHQKNLLPPCLTEVQWGTCLTAVSPSAFSSTYSWAHTLYLCGICFHICFQHLNWSRSPS